MANPKSRLRSQADKLFFELLLKPECEVCGKSAVQVHHFFYKSSYGHLRYDLDNGISLCQGCHFALHAQDPKRIEIEIIGYRGEEWYDSLAKRAKEKPKPSYLTIGYYKQVIEVLKHFD